MLVVLLVLLWIVGGVLLWQHALSLVLRQPVLNARRILLVTAHPDDECMFFGPAILGLLKQGGSTCNRLYLLCISDGDASQLGSTRRQELYESGRVLGIAKEDIRILSNIELQDGMKNYWDEGLIADELQKICTDWRIDTLLTFDAGGVSGHPNHIALIEGAKFYRATHPSVAIYSLLSTALVRKYLFILDYIPSFVLLMPRRAAIAANKTLPKRLVFVNNFAEWQTCQRSMIKHWSQMVWFRWGWIGIGRYMVINELVRVD